MAKLIERGRVPSFVPSTKPRRLAGIAQGILTALLISITYSPGLHAFDNPVVPKAHTVTFSHGTLVHFSKDKNGNVTVRQATSVADATHTHAGVDLAGAPAGSPVHAFATGIVKKVIHDPKQKGFGYLGYMVLMEHPKNLMGKTFYTLYLHLQKAPKVKPGVTTIAAGTIIGYVGKTGTVKPHTHFEARLFPEVLKKHKDWNNIYGKGDQRATDLFINSWLDPLVLFNRYPNGLEVKSPSQNPANGTNPVRLTEFGAKIGTLGIIISGLLMVVGLRKAGVRLLFLTIAVIAVMTFLF